MTATKSLLGLAQTMQAAALVGKGMKITKKKQITTRDMVDLGMTNIVGISLIKAQADITAGL